MASSRSKPSLLFKQTAQIVYCCFLVTAVALFSACAATEQPAASAEASQITSPTTLPTSPATPTASHVPTTPLIVLPTATPTTAATSTATSTPSATATLSPKPEPTPMGAVVLIIIDGARWSETFGDPNHQFIPHMANDLAPLGSINTTFYNDGMTLSVPGHAAIVTGTWQDIANNGKVRPSAPTIFEYYRAAFDAPASDAVFVHGSFIEPALTYSTDPNYGEDFGAQMFFSDKPTVPYDDGMWANAKQVISELHPHLLMISLLDPDEAAHLGQWSNYRQAIQHDDEIIWDLWQQLQADPFYAGQTTLIVTDDHGRGCGNGWRDHGGEDECNRHVLFLAVGPTIQPGLIVNRQRNLRDIAPTIGYLLGFGTPFADGAVMTELFVSN